MKKNIYTTDSFPKGKNNLTSRAGFIQRINYDAAFQEIKSNFNIDFFDLKNDYLFYLKYDLNNNIINISETRLKNIDQDLYVVDFVADAFEDLKKLCANSKTISNETLKDLKPKKGWDSLHAKYHKHVEAIYKNFINYINNFNITKKILNFDDFILHFVKYLDQIAYKSPFLKSSYLLSDDYSLSDTGFVIEIDQIKKDKDEEKIKKYFTDYSFQEFCKLCNKTGFALDKDCPWRLIYKVYSPESEKYLEKYEINKATFTDQYFYKTQDFDLENLKNYFTIFYNTFVEQNPSAYNPKVITYNEKKITIGNIFDRKKITKEQVDLKYNNLFWFNIYSHISFVENKIKLTNEEYKQTLKNLSQSFNSKGPHEALKELSVVILNSDSVRTKGEYNFTLPIVA